MIRTFEPGDLADLSRLASAWPEHFTPLAVEGICRDATVFPTNVFLADGRLIGFVVWIQASLEAEILWIASDPESVRKGVGRELVRSVVDRLGSQLVLSVKTATSENRALRTALSGAAFACANSFFEAVGFERVADLPSFWGPHQTARLYVMRLWTMETTYDRKLA